MSICIPCVSGNTTPNSTCYTCTYKVIFWLAEKMVQQVLTIFCIFLYEFKIPSINTQISRALNMDILGAVLVSLLYNTE